MVSNHLRACPIAKLKKATRRLSTVGGLRVAEMARTVARCDVIRIGPDDSWEVIVGPRRSQPLSGYRAGFGWRLNAYCWYMGQHGGHLYLGTWDMSRVIEFLGQDAENIAHPFKPLLNLLSPRPRGWGSPMGGDLYRTADGIRWEPVLLDGLGNPDNHGLRTLESTPMGLFVGSENPFSRLEVWLLRE